MKILCEKKVEIEYQIIMYLLQLRQQQKWMAEITKQ